MRIIVDYLAEGKNYIPTKQKINHLEALLLMLKALTGDDRYEEIIPVAQQQEKEKGAITVCELLDKYENRGMERGIEKGVRVLIETCKELGLSRADTLIRTKDKFDLQIGAAEGYLVKYWH